MSDRFKRGNGIGLYKIRYQMDIKGEAQEKRFAAGVVAYSNGEAVKTLTEFCRKNVKGFKGFRISEMNFEGLVHAVSDVIRDQIIKTAILEGRVVSKEDYDAACEEAKSNLKRSK